MVESLPPHLLPLGAGGWALWRRNALRSAGFPVALIDRLGDPALATAVDRALATETALATARDAVRSAIDDALDALRRDDGWDDPDRRKPLLRARKAATRGAVQTLAELGFGPEAETLENAQREHERAESALAAAFETTLAAEAEALYQTACDPRFREAVLWQNRAAFHTGVEPVAAHPPAAARANAERRYAEKMIASYLQRYAVKNDTIGFFGPSVPFELLTEGAALEVRPGRGLIAASQVGFESWCLEELARPFARQQQMRPWLCPLRSPLVRLEGHALHVPGQPPRMLAPAVAAVLAACDGRRNAREIALALGADPALGFGDARLVFALLEKLAAQRLVSWDFVLPATPEAAAAFARQIAAIGDPQLRADARQLLDELESVRAEVAASQGEAAALDGALERLETTFQRLTGKSPTRRAGQVYSGRTLVYLDCLRDVEVSCGPELRRALAAPLALVLDAARWLTGEVASAAHQVFGEVFHALARGAGTVEGIAFVQALNPRLAAPSFLAPARRQLAERWQQLLGATPETRRLELETRALAGRAAELFACPGPAWPQARCHSPDVLLAAASPEAVRAGDYQLVLGEVHVGINTLNSWAFLGVWPEREAIGRQIDLDLPETRFLMAGGKELEGVTTRTVPAHGSPHELVVLTGADPMVRGTGRDLPAAEIVVESAAGRLIARTRDGRHRVDLLTAFGNRLSALATQAFTLVPPARHTPRITLDRLVVHRESWRVPAEETLAFAGLKTTAERFYAARRWSQGLGMPRRVFVKSPLEPKPVYVDLASPTYVDLLARMALHAGEQSTPQRPLVVSFSEMLPTPDQTWLHDAEGRRYTSELRLVVIDRRGIDGA